MDTGKAAGSCPVKRLELARKCRKLDSWARDAGREEERRLLETSSTCSAVNWARREGRDCVKALLDSDSTLRLLVRGQGEEEEEVECPSRASSVPVRELLDSSSCSSLDMVAICEGSEPPKPAEGACSTRKLDSRAISVGREEPVNLLPPSESCCNRGKEPIQEGMGPTRRLSWT